MKNEAGGIVVTFSGRIPTFSTKEEMKDVGGLDAFVRRLFAEGDLSACDLDDLEIISVSWEGE